MLVVVLALSGLGKLKSLRSSAHTMRALRLQRWAAYPRTTVATTAAAELVLALGLLGTRGLTFIAIATGAWIAMIGFLFVAVRAARLGSVDECGCFGSLLPSRVGPSLTRRNVALLMIASSVLGAAAVSLSLGDPPAVLSDEASVVGTMVVAVAALACGAIIAAGVPTKTSRARAESPPTAAASPEGAVLFGSDGEVVDPVQRALRGRGQLLVFLIPGCSSCDDVALAACSASVGMVEVRLIAAVGDGNVFAFSGDADGDLPAPFAYADPAGHLAQQLGAPHARPAAALLTASGQILHSFAEGREEVLELIAAVAAAVEANAPISSALPSQT